MHSPSYQNLQKKLNSTGREYMEGFSSSDFEGLTSSEWIEIVNSLKLRAEKHDGVSLDGLRCALKESDFLEFAKDLLARHADAGLFSAQLLTTIIRYSIAADMWHRLIVMLKDGDEASQRWILNNLPLEGLSEQWAREITSVLAEQIEKESDKAMLASRVGAFLLIKKYVPRSEEFIRLARQLQEVDRRDRKRTLEELGYQTENRL
jgi:hypothetical protein